MPSRRSRRDDALSAALGYFRDLGVDDLHLASRPGPTSEAPAGAADRRKGVVGTEAPRRGVRGAAADPAPPALDRDLESVGAAVAACELCGLCRSRKQTVFADGSGRSGLMFVGEAPGADEDATGVPFVGRAGQLLTKMIEAGMGLSRKDVYIANVLKCRPPGNRNPEADEIESCRPYLEAQLDLVRPAVIVALGKFAAQFLLETDEPITKLRGKWGTRRGIPVMPTYHPSFLLRQPERKKEAWEDLQQVLRKLGLPVPGRRDAGS